MAQQHKDAVYRQMIRTCGNREDAEDVLIEALLKAYRHLDQLRESDAFRSWLAQIARRVCWQLKQREALAPLVQLSSVEEESGELPAVGESQEVEIARREMKELLLRAVESLPAQEREVYRMRDLEEMSGDDVAKKLGISSAAMKSRLHRARQSVRTFLDGAMQRSRSSET